MFPKNPQKCVGETDEKGNRTMHILNMMWQIERRTSPFVNKKIRTCEPREHRTYYVVLITHLWVACAVYSRDTLGRTLCCLFIQMRSTTRTRNLLVSLFKHTYRMQFREYICGVQHTRCIFVFCHLHSHTNTHVSSYNERWWKACRWRKAARHVCGKHIALATSTLLACIEIYAVRLELMRQMCCAHHIIIPRYNLFNAHTVLSRVAE